MRVLQMAPIQLAASPLSLLIICYIVNPLYANNSFELLVAIQRDYAN